MHNCKASNVLYKRINWEKKSFQIMPETIMRTCRNMSEMSGSEFLAMAPATKKAQHSLRWSVLCATHCLRELTDEACKVWSYIEHRWSSMNGWWRWHWCYLCDDDTGTWVCCCNRWSCVVPSIHCFYAWAVVHSSRLQSRHDLAGFVYQLPEAMWCTRNRSPEWADAAASNLALSMALVTVEEIRT